MKNLEISYILTVMCVAGVFVFFVGSIRGCTENADKLKLECSKTKSVDECARLIRH
jgi:hypothetical protein